MFKGKSSLRSVSRVNFDETFSLHKQVCQTPAGRPGGLPLQGLSSCSLSLKGDLICFSPASPRTANDPHLHLLQPNCLIDPERVPHLDKHTHTQIFIKQILLQRQFVSLSCSPLTWRLVDSLTHLFLVIK